MNKLIKLTALILLFSCKKIDTPYYLDKLNLYMDVESLIGQSNMAGTVYTKLQPPIDSVNIMAYKVNTGFQTLQPGVNASYLPYFMGIQTYLGKSLLKEKHKPIYLFQPAYGGTAIDKWRPTQPMWEYIAASVPQIKEYAKAQNKIARFKNAVWYQGEADAVKSTWDSATYRKALEIFIDNYRALVGYDTRFIIIQFPDCYKQVPVKHLLEIRDVQRKIGNQRNNVLVPYEVTDGCAGDGIHLNRETYEKKAEAIYRIIH